MAATINYLRKAADRLLFARKIALFRREAESFFSSPVGLYDLTGAGATFTFLVRDGHGKNLCVAKVFHPRRERISRGVNSRFKEYTYLQAQERFAREAEILQKLSALGLAPRPIRYSHDYLLEEYIEGSSLLDAAGGQEERFAELIFAGLRLLKKMHEHDIYHGQPSLRNMLICREIIKAIDFEHCLNAQYLSKEQMAAFDRLRFILDAEKSRPELFRRQQASLSRMLKDEFGESALAAMEEAASFGFFQGNDSAVRLMRRLLKAQTAPEDIIDIEPVYLPRDMAEILAVSPRVPAQAISAIYKRFPQGMFKLKKNGRVVAYLSVGFQRPEIILRCIAKLPFFLNRAFFDFLVRRKMVRDCEIATLSVAENARHQGIGRRLAGFAEDFARSELGQPALHLLVRKENRAACSLYEKSGYRECGTLKLKNGYKIRMKKLLKP